LERGQENNWFQSRWITAEAIGTVITLTTLVLWELRTREPIIQFRVLRNRSLSVGAGMGLVFGMVLFGTTFSLPQLTQQLLHYPAYQAGLVLLPRSLTLFLLMPLVGWLFNYVDPRLLMAVGISITYWAFHHLAQLALTVGFWNLVPIMLLMGAGMPCVFVTLSTVSLRTVRREDMTAATSLYTLARSVGGNMGYALVATMLERFSIVHQAYLSAHISSLNTVYPGYATALAARLSHQTGDPVAVQSQALALVEALLHRQAAMLAYNDVARVFGVLFLCTLPLLWFFPRRKRAQPVRPSPGH
jgi:DHA2 family multidrug resistance protein